MKAVVLALATIVVPVAAADPLPMQAALPSSQPTTTSDRTCTEPGQIITSSRVVGAARATILHGCGSTDAESTLVLQIDDAWFSAPPVLIAYQGANMTEAPAHVSLVAERLVAGTLGDGSRAVVHVVTTRTREIETKTGDVVSNRQRLRVQVCTLDATPQCADIETDCPARGCAIATLARGTLRLARLGAPPDLFTIERDPALEPQP